jgi:uncharacterized protein with HEPN domain
LRRGHEVQKFVAGLNLEQYSGDHKTRLTVERSFEIIGEALNRSFKIAPVAGEPVVGFEAFMDAWHSEKKV